METELRELRQELKAARNDVKRYASYALRLQQELAREKQKRRTANELLDEEDVRFSDLNKEDEEPLGTSVWDKKVDRSRTAHDAWGRKIDQMVQMMAERRGEAAMAKEGYATIDNQTEESVEYVIQNLSPFLKQQKRLVVEMERENAKLREMLRVRPTRRELVVEIDRLQRNLQKLRARAKNTGHVPRKVPEEHQPVETGSGENVPAMEASLSERITEERLLQMLRINSEKSATHHKYLKEKLHCYLSLDTARLSQQHDFTETGILEHVGRICTDIVASCCYVLEVKEVGELPNCVEKARKLSQVSATYQDFVDRIEKLLNRFDKDAFFSTRAEFNADTSCREALQIIVSHVNDVLVELDARREQMKPPGSKAHEVLLASMKLLQVARVDQLTPTIRRLVDNMRAEQDFQRDLRELFGLDESANKKQILHVASTLFGELGFHGKA